MDVVGRADVDRLNLGPTDDLLEIGRDRTRAKALRHGLGARKVAVACHLEPRCARRDEPLPGGEVTPGDSAAADYRDADRAGGVSLLTRSRRRGHDYFLRRSIIARPGERR